MHYEVEQKYPLEDLLGIEAKLAAAGAEVSEPRCEADWYYAHPARDFAATDEALRIRRLGPANSLTYKGPRVDATTKTRREIELRLESGEGAAAAWGGLLEVLGFRPVAEVRKRRRKARVPWQGRLVELSLDEVEELGTFVELELLAAPEDIEAAKACLASLADGLGLGASERRSYLELLLEKRKRGSLPP